MGYDWGMWGFGAIFMVLFWVFIIGGTVWLVLTLSGQRDCSVSTGADQTALPILEERLARGEIDIEAFRARKAAIEGTKR